MGVPPPPPGNRVLMFEEEPIGRFGFDSYKFTDGRKERDRE